MRRRRGSVLACPGRRKQRVVVCAYRMRHITHRAYVSNVYFRTEAPFLGGRGRDWSGRENKDGRRTYCWKNNPFTRIPRKPNATKTWEPINQGRGLRHALVQVVEAANGGAQVHAVCLGDDLGGDRRAQRVVEFFDESLGLGSPALRYPTAWFSAGVCRRWGWDSPSKRLKAR